MKYTIARTDTRIQNAYQTVIHGRPSSEDVIGQTNSLRDAIEQAHRANEERDGGRYSGARIQNSDGSHWFIAPVVIPTAYQAIQRIAGEPTFEQLNEMMEKIQYGDWTSDSA